MVAVIVAIAVIAIAEAVISGLWFPWYFRHGFVIFRERATLRHLPNLAPARLARFNLGGLSPSLRFRHLSESEIAFQQAVFSAASRRATPVMYGRITFDPKTMMLEVRGLAHWTALASAGALAVNACVKVAQVGWTALRFHAFAAGVFALLYGFQHARFHEIVDILVSDDRMKPDEPSRGEATI